MIRRFLRGEAGAAMLEFALAGMLFFLTVFGTVEMGIAVWHKNLATSLAQEGARWASVRGKTTPVGTRATIAAVEQFVKSRALGLSVIVTTAPVPATLVPGQTITVEVSTTYRPIVSGLIRTGPIQLSSRAGMIMAR